MKDFVFPLVLGVTAAFAAFGIVKLMQLEPAGPEQAPLSSHTVKSVMIGPDLKNGLHHVTIDDSVTVLIYKHYEGVSMIQVK